MSKRKVRDFSDVSSYQGSIDFEAYARENDLIVIKATEGLTVTDPSFQARWRAARAAGVVRAPYHFARPQPGRTGAQEAEHFLQVVRDAGGFKPGDLPPVLDIETGTGLNAIQYGLWARSFNRRVRQELTELHFTRRTRRPIIYTGSFWRGMVAGATGAYLWLAAYVADPKPYVPEPWSTRIGRWIAWQFTDRGTTAGIKGTHDRSHFRGRLGRLEKIQLKKRRKNR